MNSFALIETYGGRAIYAIIETGGKQYRVAPGEKIKTELVGVTPGDTVELDRVLLVSDDNGTTVGNPTVDGAKVTASASGCGRTRKQIVFKYKAKTRYHRKKGHRQDYTELVVQDIVLPGQGKAKVK